MRLTSITLKLTLAFLAIGLLGAALVSLYVGLRAQLAFDRFFFELQQTAMVATLTDYYQTEGSWRGVDRLFREDHAWPQHDGTQPMAVTLTDPNHRVLVGSRRHPPGSILRAPGFRAGVSLTVDGQVIGHLYFENVVVPWQRGTPEREFLVRIQRAILLSAVTAGLAALVAGSVLAQNLTQPILRLTEATNAVAQGDLGHQVQISQQDEIGELARAFNQMSADLAHTNQLRRQMTADIAHDLRTPLSVLVGYTEGLSDGKLQGTLQTYATMHRETQHLSRLVNDLRLLSLVDAGELPLNRVPVTPQALLDRAAAAHWVQARDQKVALCVETEDGLPMIVVDPERLAQVLDNLIVNALRYTPSGGSITLRAETVDHSRTVTLSVSDTGSGIAPEDLPNVFERFYRGDDARTHDNGASGLGLAIARSLVHAHGGTVSVESRLGKGATFTLSLPAQA